VPNENVSALWKSGSTTIEGGTRRDLIPCTCIRLGVFAWSAQSRWRGGVICLATACLAMVVVDKHDDRNQKKRRQVNFFEALGLSFTYLQHRVTVCTSSTLVNF